jgi:hypothetical protein
MFPGLRQRFDDALDLIVEFSTLGEYRLAAPVAGGPTSALVDSPSGRAPRLGGAGHRAARAADRQVAKGPVVIARGAAGRASLRGTAATPAARRLMAARTRRPGTPAAPEQLCLAV